MTTTQKPPATNTASIPLSVNVKTNDLNSTCFIFPQRKCETISRFSIYCFLIPEN